MADVGIVMGSDSDWPTMEAAATALAEFGVSYSAEVVSAHRMPEDMVAFGRSAHENGFRVIIAGAGGAAHLPVSSICGVSSVSAMAGLLS